MGSFHRIVAATDFSATAQHALGLAAGMARDAGAHLHVVHAVPEAVSPPWMVLEGGIADYDELQRRWLSDARRRLASIVAGLPLEAGDVTSEVVSGATAAAILRYAAEHGADLIVLGTHGDGADTHVALGSVAERVLRRARCPVLAVPRPPAEAG